MNTVKQGTGITIWLTGLSGAGKTTTANALYSLLNNNNNACEILDGDDLRHGLNSDLGFSQADRHENLRRLAEVAKLFNLKGFITIVSAISPYRQDRQMVRELHQSAGLEFIEVYIATPLEVCELRDPKHYYAKARAGEIKHFTGVDDPYEPPTHAELILDTQNVSPEQCAARIHERLETIKDKIAL